MNTLDSPLSVYCGKGRIERLRFLSSVSKLQKHVREALQRLGVTENLIGEIVAVLPSVHFGEGFRFEGDDTSIGHSEPDCSEPAHPDARRAVVFVQFYNEMLERCIAKTTGELKPFDEVVQEPEQTEGEKEPAIPASGDRRWRRSA
ncbi:MAG: hypothetical protein PHX87_05870 [Candidatus Peribacteraceae bacterium]|nr:hypothetical protein [Candidatus Peribacteraceae bacterium]MDD5742919.1 hypothetical protein [Candidatus Peribacteraceae bacterium]